MRTKISTTFSIDIKVANKIPKLPPEAQVSQAVNNFLKQLLVKYKVK